MSLGQSLTFLFREVDRLRARQCAATDARRLHRTASPDGCIPGANKFLLRAKAFKSGNLPALNSKNLSEHSKKITPPESGRMRMKQMYRVRVFDELIYDTDANLTNWSRSALFDKACGPLRNSSKARCASPMRRWCLDDVSAVVLALSPAVATSQNLDRSESRICLLLPEHLRAPGHVQSDRARASQVRKRTFQGFVSNSALGANRRHPS